MTKKRSALDEPADVRDALTIEEGQIQLEVCGSPARPCFRRASRWPVTSARLNRLRSGTQSGANRLSLRLTNW
jgi:hypothetical protein